MSNKLNQASLKISKKNNEKLEFNSLIKVLRPKVYITDSSSFKKLVQELTGNTTITTTTTTLTTTSSPTPPPPLEPKMVESFTTLIETDDDEVLIMDHNPETSVEVSLSNETTTTTTTSSSHQHESCYNNALMMMDNEFNQICNQICLENIFLQDSSLPNQPLLDHNLWAYQNLESLLFDDDDDEILNPFFNCYAQIEPPEVSIYDYELSGLL